MITRHAAESVGLVVICLWLTGFLAWYSPHLLRGGLGLLLVAGTVLGALWTVVLNLQHGKSPIASLADIVVFGALAFAVPYCVVWCFTLLLAI